MKGYKQNFKSVSLLVLLFVLVFSGCSAFFSSTAGAVAPISIANKTCPKGTTFTMGDSSHAPSCFKSNPKSQDDCPAGATFKAPSLYEAVTCVSAGDYPESQKDCPKGTKFSRPAIGYGPSICASQGQSPTSQADCPKGTTFRPADLSGHSNRCVNPAEEPKSQADCPKDTIFDPGNGSASDPATCGAGSRAAQAFCDDSSGKEYDACITGYDNTGDDGCKAFSGSNLTKCKAAQAAAKAAASADDDSSTPTCENSGPALSWILCKIIDLASAATDSIYSDLVKPMLETKPLNISDPNGDPTHLYDIWSNFRIYGDIFLVIALLVIVFGESIGGGLIDAYAAKKILPRLLIAAVLINLSIYIVSLLVDFTNIIGSGVAALIEAPFRLSGTYNIHIGEATSGLGLAGLTGGAIWAVAGAGALLEFLFLMLVIPAFLTFLGILITVIIRQGLIIFLVLVSPIAFALYCLPNTQQYFRKWWDLLVKTLLVYPLIAILFALGNVMSVTINQTASGITGAFTALVSVVALFVPLFLIPYSFRIAGGFIGRVGEFASNSRKRSHEAIKGRENDPDSWRNRSKSKLRHRYEERGMTGKGLATNVIPPTNPFSKSGRQEWRQNREARRASSRTLSGQRFLEHDSVALANQGSDQYYAAVADRRLAERRRNDALAKGTPEGAAEARSWDQAIANANITPKTPAIRMAAAQKLAGTGFVIAPRQQGYNELGEMMESITGATVTRDAAGNITGATGNRAGAWADAMDNAQFAQKGAGRFDLAGINRGAGYAPLKGLEKASLYEIANGKPESIQAMAEDLPVGPVSQEHAVAYKELQAMLPNSKGAARNEIVKQVQALESRGVRGYMAAPVPGQNPRRGRVSYDDTAPNAGTWTPEERVRGWRAENVQPTYGDLAQQSARSYERPDPNNVT